MNEAPATLPAELHLMLLDVALLETSFEVGWPAVEAEPSLRNKRSGRSLRSFPTTLNTCFQQGNLTSLTVRTSSPPPTFVESWNGKDRVMWRGHRMIRHKSL